jgi:predicted CoA-binding protein
MKSTVVILGASPKADRYSNMAQKMLMDSGFSVYPVAPKGGEIYGLPVSTKLGQIDKPVDTITLYINPKRLEEYAQDIIKLAPRRVIFNPGTESPHITQRFAAAGIETTEGCTLVLLRTGQF